MIKAQVLYKDEKNPQDKCVCGFDVYGHGDPVVCSAVSFLVLNTVNSIDVLTDAAFSFDGDAQNGGDIRFIVTEFDDGGKAQLLLQSLYLGLVSLAEQYTDDIVLIE